MKHPARYRLKLEDESHLQNVADVGVSLWGALGVVIIVLIAAVALAVAVIVFTPLRNFLPGYLPPQERAATMDDVLRVDSIRERADANEAYMQNLMTILDTDREGGDSLKWAQISVRSTGDSLMTDSQRERDFRRKIDEREKYNLSILAPLAADGMIFEDPAPGYAFARGSESQSLASVILPAAEMVRTVADGTVADVHFSPRGGYVVIIQHANGFLSRWSRLGLPLVEEGKEITAGDIIAPTAGASGRNSTVTLEMWRNGTRLIPFNILHGEHRRAVSSSSKTDVADPSTRTPGK